MRGWRMRCTRGEQENIFGSWCVFDFWLIQPPATTPCSLLAARPRGSPCAAQVDRVAGRCAMADVFRVTSFKPHEPSLIWAIKHPTSAVGDRRYKSAVASVHCVSSGSCEDSSCESSATAARRQLKKSTESRPSMKPGMGIDGKATGRSAVGDSMGRHIKGGAILALKSIVLLGKCYHLSSNIWSSLLS